MARDLNRYFGGNVDPYDDLHKKNSGVKPDGPWWVKLLIGVIFFGVLIGMFIWLLNQ